MLSKNQESNQRMSPQTLVIGSKFYGHDSSMFVVMPEEKRLCALQTERVTRYKHDRAFPVAALERVIEYERIDRNEVKQVVFCNSFKLMMEQTRLPENLYEIEMLFQRTSRRPTKRR